MIGALIAAFAVLRATKLEGRPAARLAVGDVLWALALAAALAGARATGVAAVVVAAGMAIVALVALLVLDVVMWRTFTIELGPRGAGDVVLSVLAEELGALASARRFVRAHATLALVPLAVLLASLGGAALAVGASCLAMAAGASQPARRGAAAWVGVALALVEWWVVLPAAHPAMLAPFAFALVLARPLRGVAPSLAGDFLFSRPLLDTAGFAPKPEHAPLLALAPRAPVRSPSFGLLAGRDVVLVTIESLGTVHRAKTPFIDALAARGLGSALHVSPAPTTNDAHEAIYRAGYGGGWSAVAALRDAGWETVYATTATTAYYGLRALLEGAGFTRIFDRRDLGAGDAALHQVAPAKIGARRGPRFVHVMTADSHVPYTVRDPSFDDRGDDLARYLRSIEEADAIAARTVDALIAAGAVEDPLLVVTGDHGQAFGALGYLTHGSAVTAEELLVPFAMAHASLPPARVEWSTHFDVMPTILDLLGVEGAPSFGQPLLAPPEARPRQLVVRAGHPSRATTSHHGVLTGDTKLLIDRVTGEAWRTDWRDTTFTRLEGEARRYAEALCTAAFTRLGLR